ncbi:hypothetical protein [Lacticaseibacillus mingshuiensis]|uniref:LPXTG cell wall anchor domain-containing protein n=1 Tax=Lacticaseibacillus mingshuiensis TaxID=2799574 RepID=A0ABW4CI78_9LACO|nr:hypothetical protein [Lacticaseibacillus mingshuiensis]
MKGKNRWWLGWLLGACLILVSQGHQVVKAAEAMQSQAQVAIVGEALAPVKPRPTPPAPAPTNPARPGGKTPSQVRPGGIFPATGEEAIPWVTLIGSVILLELWLLLLYGRRGATHAETS